MEFVIPLKKHFQLNTCNFKDLFPKKTRLHFQKSIPSIVYIHEHNTLDHYLTHYKY